MGGTVLRIYWPDWFHENVPRQKSLSGPDINTNLYISLSFGVPCMRRAQTTRRHGSEGGQRAAAFLARNCSSGGETAKRVRAGCGRVATRERVGGRKRERVKRATGRGRERGDSNCHNYHNERASSEGGRASGQRAITIVVARPL